MRTVTIWKALQKVRLEKEWAWMHGKDGILKRRSRQVVTFSMEITRRLEAETEPE